MHLCDDCIHALRTTVRHVPRHLLTLVIPKRRPAICPRCRMEWRLSPAGCEPLIMPYVANLKDEHG